MYAANRNMPSVNSGRETFESIFNEYYFRVKSFTEGFVKDRFSSEEIVQNVFLKLWKKKGALDNISNISAYIFKICKNEIIDYYRSADIRRTGVTVNNVPDREYDQFTEQTLDCSIIRNAVHEFISNLPEQRKRVFIMSREQNMSNAEIAEKLCISQRTVETHISKTLAQLRDFLSALKFLIFFI